MTTRALNKLSARGIDALPDGNHSDGGGLSLLVTNNGQRRSWVLRYTSPVLGKVREMGLGKAGAGGVPLKQAREERDRLRTMLRDGIDPLEARKEARTEQARKAQESAGRKTVRQAADAYIDQKQREWGASSLAAWRRFAEHDIEPIAALAIADIGLDAIKRAVTPLVAASRTNTARATQSRLHALLDYAGEHGWRPEDKRSHFSQIAPKARKGDEPKHHPALNPDRDADAIRAAVARLRASPTMSALALEFVILTAVRVSEGLGATWDEIDFNTALWTIPAARMKMGREHIVPLSDRALAIIRSLDAAKGKERKHVFPGARPGRPMGRTAAYNCCERVTGGRASPHGWRSSFRSWCSETGVAFEVAELSLAHGKDKIVAAYDRSAMIGRRWAAMQDWTNWLSGPATAEVIEFRRPGP
jgi:integrase